MNGCGNADAARRPRKNNEAPLFVLNVNAPKCYSIVYFVVLYTSFSLYLQGAPYHRSLWYVDGPAALDSNVQKK
eukprot:scaffold630646_cov17-Prasinocladus_malaysianus.AAC.1